MICHAKIISHPYWCANTGQLTKFIAFKINPDSNPDPSNPDSRIVIFSSAESKEDLDINRFKETLKKINKFTFNIKSQDYKLPDFRRNFILLKMINDKELIQKLIELFESDILIENENNQWFLPIAFLNKKKIKL